MTAKIINVTLKKDNPLHMKILKNAKEFAIKAEDTIDSVKLTFVGLYAQMIAAQLSKEGRA